jgi:hypothetical protein
MEDRGVEVRMMPKKTKKPNENSQESTLGPLAKTLSEVDGDTPTEGEPDESASGGDIEPAPEGADEKGEAPPEGDGPQEG